MSPRLVSAWISTGLAACLVVFPRFLAGYGSGEGTWLRLALALGLPALLLLVAFVLARTGPHSGRRALLITIGVTASVFALVYVPLVLVHHW